MPIERNPDSLPQGVRPIDWLVPGSKQHEWVRAQLLERLSYSERRMSAFHSRWRSNELLLQAYISLNDYDKMLNQMNADRKGPGVPVEINVPYAWATTNTIVTYLMHMFGGRRPIFNVSSYRPEQVKRAQNMEMLLQYNADYVKFVRALYFFLMDAETYGVAVLRTMWATRQRERTVLVPPDPLEAELMASFGRQAQPTRQRQTYVAFEGNEVTNVDPFMFFPDPRVPMHEVNEKGEFVFWRALQGRHMLLREEAAGRVRWVDKADDGDTLPGDNLGSGASARGMRALGTSDPFADGPVGSSIRQNVQVDQGTVEIVPRDWGLGAESVPQKWLFSIANKRQIIQAERIDTPLNKHPIEVAEPNSVGYSFGQLGTVDMLGPMQGMMSWFLNSHIYNVRASLNNLLVVDPSKVEMQDLAAPEPGGLIRLKNTAFGMSDPRAAIMQLQVSDVTRSHISDFQLMSRLASDLTGATDNVRGLQEAGGRKTATEVRTSAEAGTSRLASKGKVLSSMAFTGLAEQHTWNFQNFLSQPVELALLGSGAAKDTVRIGADEIAGDFFFPVHDGTLPVDKVGLLGVWKEIFQAVLMDPELRQSTDVIGMFTWLAQLGGAQNIQSFLKVQPQSQAMEAIGSGQAVPLDAAMQGLAAAAPAGGPLDPSMIA